MKYLFLITCLATSYFSQAQSGLGQRIIIGNSLTLIIDADKQIDSRFTEFTWNKDIATNINRRLYFGISNKSIFTKGAFYDDRSTKNKYFISGAFLQYDFLGAKKDRIYAEVSFNYGNYCTCGDGEYYSKEWLHYVGIGAGYDLPLGNFFSLNIAWVSYIIVKHFEERDWINHYEIGLNFDFLR